MSLEVVLTDDGSTLMPEPGDDVFLDVEELEQLPGMQMFDTQALQRQIDDLLRKVKDHEAETDKALSDQHTRHYTAIQEKREEITELEGELAGSKQAQGIAEDKARKFQKAIDSGSNDLLEYVLVYERRWMKAHMAIRVLLERLSHPMSGNEAVAGIVMNLRKSMDDEPEPVFHEPIEMGAEEYLAGVFNIVGKHLGHVKDSDEMHEGAVLAADMPVENEEKIKTRPSVLQKIKKTLGIE